jgi:hypothetical protein
LAGKTIADVSMPGWFMWSTRQRATWTLPEVVEDTAENRAVWTRFESRSRQSLGTAIGSG